MVRVIDEHILRGNSATLKCLIPSFIADFVEVISWETDENEIFTMSETGYNDIGINFSFYNFFSSPYFFGQILDYNIFLDSF